MDQQLPQITVASLADAEQSISPPWYYVAWASALMTRRSHVLYGMLFHCL